MNIVWTYTMKKQPMMTRRRKPAETSTNSRAILRCGFDCDLNHVDGLMILLTEKMIWWKPDTRNATLSMEIKGVLWKYVHIILSYINSVSRIGIFDKALYFEWCIMEITKVILNSGLSQYGNICCFFVWYLFLRWIPVAINRRILMICFR